MCAVQSKDADTNNYTVSCTPIGCYSETDDEVSFRQGGVNLPSPTEPAYLPDDEVINAIFSSNDNFSFQIGSLSNNDAVNYFVDGNKFFGKHIAAEPPEKKQAGNQQQISGQEKLFLMF